MLNWVAAHRPENYGNNMQWQTFMEKKPYLNDPIPWAYNPPVGDYPVEEVWLAYYSLKDVWFGWRGKMYICDITLASVSILVAIAQPHSIRYLRLWAIIDFLLGGLWVTVYAFLQISATRSLTNRTKLGCLPTANMLVYDIGGQTMIPDRVWNVWRHFCGRNIQMAYITAVLIALTWFVTCGVRISYYRETLKKPRRS